LNQNNDDIGNALLQRTNNYQNTNVSNYKVDYAQPITHKGTLETGYKAITRFSNNDYKNKYNVNNEYILNNLNSNIFIFKEQIHAAYLQYKSYVGKEDSAKWKYDVGLRAEQVFNTGKVVNGSTFNRNYFNVFPTANIAYYINANDFIKLNLTRRINRPGLGQLNPFVDITDSLNRRGGNPNLNPELVNAAEVGYNKEWKKVSFSINVYYRYATNIIRPYAVLLNNGVILTQPTNFGSGTTYGFENMVTFYPTKFWSANASASIYQQNIDGSNVSADVANNLLSWYGKWINNFTLWKGAKLQVTGSYNSPVASPQGQRVASYFVDAGFQQKILKNKGGLGLTVTDIFNTQINGYSASTISFKSSRTFKMDTRAVLLTFAYTFGTKFKETLMENKFSND
jgi:outer membrane receptor protein involved in Fe transport